MLQVTDLNYRISPNLSLEHISFDVQPGELLIVLGANGAGKSTLLQLLTGTLLPDSGTVLVKGRPLGDWSNKERAAFSAVLHQQNHLQLPFSVQEVAMMGRYPHFSRHAGEQDERIVSNSLAQVGIAHLSDRNYLTLSGGEQQRVHLARVLAQICPDGKSSNEVSFLYMDEPGNSLDIRHQHAALQIARSLAQAGNCVVAVLHELNLALQYADKILMLQHGKIKAWGKPADVITEEIISSVYDLPLQIFKHPSYGHPIVMPAVNTISN